MLPLKRLGPYFARYRARLLVGIACVFGAAMVGLAAPLLIGGTQGAWITAPGPVRLLSRVIVPGQTQPPLRFSRVVRVHGPGEAARIRLRALGRVELRLNGQLIAEDRRCFKRACEIAVGPLLRAGPNAIEASVRNARGPEALSAILEAPGLRLGTDETWRVARGDAGTHYALEQPLGRGLSGLARRVHGDGAQVPGAAL